MKLTVFFTIENEKGERISINEEEAERLYERLETYFNEEQYLVEEMRRVPTLPLDPVVPNPIEVTYSDKT